MVSTVNWLFVNKIGQFLLLIAVLIAARHFIRLYLVLLIKKAVSSNNTESVDEQQKRVDTLVNTLGTLLTIGLFLVGVFVALVILEQDILGLLAGFSAAGVIFGLIGQSLIKDILAGLYILIENQYRVGDVVTLDTVSGTVETISLRITRLRDFNGDLHIVSNGSVQVITNKTFGWSNVNMVINVDYDSDINKVEKIINDVGIDIADDEEWSMHIVEPIAFLRVDNFGESSVEIRAIGRVEAGQQWAVAGEFRQRLKTAFDKVGIEIPYPQRVVHSKKSTSK